MFSGIVTSAEAVSSASDLLILHDDRPAPDGVRVYRVVQPGQLSTLAAALFGDFISGLSLASLPIDLSGLPADQEREFLDAVTSLSQQWGNSTLDGAHGISNLMHNAPTLLAAPRIRKPLTHQPVIAVGGGPSTAALLDAIRESGCIVVACDAALGPLLAAGIRPAFCTPLERLNSTTAKLPRSTGDVAFAGTPWVPADTVQRFTRHTFWPTVDPAMDWLGITDGDLSTGSTTGTCAAAVALRLTSGPVYLVGHDLCGGHMPGADVSASLADGFDTERLGYDGKLHPTKTAWLRAKYDLEGMDTGRLINAGGHAGMGLRLDGVAVSGLPTWVDGSFAMPETNHADLIDAFKERASFLNADLRQAASQAQAATSISAVGLGALCPERSQDPIAYILRPLYAQCSLERRLGRSDADVLATFQDGIVAIASTLEGTFHGCV